MEKSRRTRLASAGVLAVVFGSGALVGVAVERSSAAPPALAAEVVAPTGAPEQGQGGRSGQSRGRGPQRPALYEQVGLAPEQLERADSLVRVHRAALESLQREFRRTTDSILAASWEEQELRQKADAHLMELRGGIRSMMLPGQLLMYDSLLAEDERRRSMEREGRPGPGGG
jgi:hypothetical protein